MQRSTAFCLLALAMSVAGLSGCRQQIATSPSGDEATVAAAPGANVSQETPAGPVPQIASGTMPSLKELATPTPLPTTSGERRVVTLEQALAAVSFTLFEPRRMPEKVYRDVVQLEQPREGEQVPGLPLVRFIYSVEPSGAIIIAQRAADGSQGEGEAVDVAGAPGWLIETEQAVIVEWEMQGTRIQLRGNGLDRNVVLTAARSMTAIQP